MMSLLDRAAAAARERIAAALRSWLPAARAGAARTWAKRPSAARAAAISYCFALGVISAWAIVRQVDLPGRLPVRLDWKAASALVDRDARSGDAVALSPPWADRAREVLPPSVAVLTQRRFEGEDLAGVRRVWLLSLPGVPRASFDAELDLMERASHSEEPQRLGAITVTRYDLALTTLPLAFLPDRLRSAEVSRGGSPCAADPEGRFRCEPGGASVERSVRDVDGVPRPCISIHAPATTGSPLVIEFPAMAVGRAVHGHGAVLDAAAPVRITFGLEGSEMGSANVTSASWTPFSIDTSRAQGQSGRISAALTAAGSLSLCLEAMVLP